MDPATLFPTPMASGESRSAVPSCGQIALAEIDRSRLQTFVHSGQQSARARTRAPVLLNLGEGWGLAEVCRAFDVCRNTVLNVRARFAEGGVDAVVRHKRQVRYRQAVTGAQAAHLVAVACSPVPDGHDHWTLRMLAGKAVELGFVEYISPETICALLKKTNSSPGGIGSGASAR